jgi:hypothetical protein
MSRARMILRRYRAILIPVGLAVMGASLAFNPAPAQAHERRQDQGEMRRSEYRNVDGYGQDRRNVSGWERINQRREMERGREVHSRFQYGRGWHFEHNEGWS